MTKTISLFAVAAIGVAMAAPAYAATDAECQDMWTKADVNKDGVLSDNELMRYAAAMRVGNRKHRRRRQASLRPSSWRPASPTST